MKQFLVTVAAFICLAAGSAFAQLKVDTEQFTAILAKSARIEPLTDRVAVFLTERDAGERTGAFLNISTRVKWVAPYSENPAVSLTRSSVTPERWMMFAVPGKYRILIIEFDPETGLKLSNIEVTIGPVVVPPPVVPPPVIVPPGDFANVAKASKDNADRLNDPPTRTALKAAYQMAIDGMSGKTFDECRSMAIASRFAVFNARQGPSRNVDWESWKNAVDVELVRLVRPGETGKYIQAMLAVIAGL